MADNFHFDLTGVPMDLALQVATLHHKAIGYRIDFDGDRHPKTRMILYWSDKDVKDLQRFPVVMGAEELAPLIKAWLSERDYGSQPDHDGDNGKGWRVYNEAWTHAAGHWQAFAIIEPVWLEYGK